MTREVLTPELEQFKAEREAVMSASDDELAPIVDEALRDYANGDADWYDAPVDAAAVLWWETFEYEQGRAPTATELAEFQSATAEVLQRTGEPTVPPDDHQVNVIAGWLSSYALNSAVAAGGDEGGPLEWVTMRDGDVRDIHAPLDGQATTAGSTFDVAGYRLHFPGEPVGPPHVWINCRCQVRRVREDTMGNSTISSGNTGTSNTTVTWNGLPPQILTSSTIAFAAGPGAPAHPEVDDDPGEDDSGDDPVEDDEEFDPGFYDDLEADVPWHGVIAPTGVMSGDRRKFAPAALRARDLPVPLTFQQAQADGHGGAVTIGNIEKIWEEEGLIKASGRFASNLAADEAIYLVADQMLQGVSVELDDTAYEFQYEDGSAYDLSDETTPPVTVVVDGRVASATLVTVPAFQEAFVALGTWEDEGTLVAGCAPCEAQAMDELYESWDPFAISEQAWDGSSSRFTPEQWFRSTVLHKSDDKENKADHGFPILEPNGDLNRAAVHNAAARINQAKADPEQVAAAKRALITAYRKLEEDPPDALTAAAFASAPGTHDGPGWVTNPRETQRLRTYWTKGKGAAKIRWGQPGDFNRCRRQLAKYVQNPQYLAGTCANLHKVALGVWPGKKRGDKHALTAAAAPAFTLVASAGDVLPAEWFRDPGLEGPTPITIDGQRVYGHIAAWDSCHTGYGISVGDGEVCVRPPRSSTDYAYFRTGAVQTDEGLVPVGNITMDTGHAGASLSGRLAAAHYDNTGAVVADVAVGEDEHGIWFAGALRTTASDEQRIALQAAALSGDWRWQGSGLELVAALVVNVPGFPIPRMQVAASGLHTEALVAAGVVEPEPTLGELVDEAVARRFAQVDAMRARHVLRAQTLARLHDIRLAHARDRLARL